MTHTLQCDKSPATSGERVTLTLSYEPAGKAHAVRWTWDQDLLATLGTTKGVQNDKDGTLHTVTGPHTRSASLSFDVLPGVSGTATVGATVKVLDEASRGGSPIDEFRRGRDEESAEVSFDIVQPEAHGGGGGSGDDGQRQGGGFEGLGQPVQVTMRRAAVDPTPSQALWTLIRQTSNALSFQSYQVFMDTVLCDSPGLSREPNSVFRRGRPDLPWRLPFPGVEPYRQLKAATETFVMLNCGVPFGELAEGGIISPAQLWSHQVDVGEELADESRRYYRPVTHDQIRDAWRVLLHQGTAELEGVPPRLRTILYLALVRMNLSDVPVANDSRNLSPQAALELDTGAVNLIRILQEKLTNPCLIELLWSYWQEEALLVQTINAVTWRFQNRRGPADTDPLANLEIDPLRSLNNFIWGYIQDEEHRLTVVRRAYEYAHEYGLPLLGKAVPAVRGADNRSRFIEGFHNLLNLCSIFYKEDDDTTVVADGFPVLNALKDVHLLLTQGAANQYGDLPWTARLEMLMQQWLLARPEFGEFLPRRVMVDYPEQWMHSVESMKALQGWTTPSVLHFRDLAVFGEQILLGIRFQAWPSIIEPQDAANWARYWRPEIQGYIYAYRAATGVDLTERADATAPGLLLQRRMRNGLPAGIPARSQASIPAATRESLAPSRRDAVAAVRPVAQLPAPNRAADRYGR